MVMIIVVVVMLMRSGRLPVACSAIMIHRTSFTPKVTSPSGRKALFSPVVLAVSVTSLVLPGVTTPVLFPLLFLAAFPCFVPFVSSVPLPILIGSFGLIKLTLFQQLRVLPVKVVIIVVKMATVELTEDFAEVTVVRLEVGKGN